MHAVSNEPLLDEFEEHLRQQGYKRKTIQMTLPSCRRFLAYLKQHGLPLEQVTPDILDTYLTAQLHLFQQRHQRLPQSHTPRQHQLAYGIPGFLRYTLGQWPPQPMPTSENEAFYDLLTRDYAQWLCNVRGLSPQTITDLQAEAKRFLNWLLRVAPDDALGNLSVAQVDAWLTDRLADKRRPTKVRLVYSLRSLLRWLHHQEFTARDLAAVVTTPSQYALEHLPSALSSEEIDRVLEQTRHDQTPKGLRDFAILTLLAIYGLRAGEIVALRLEDVDWRSERVLIQHRKTGKETVLPLLAQAGEAVLA